MAYLRKRGNKWYYTITWIDEKGQKRKAEKVGGLTKAACQKAWRKEMEKVDRTGLYISPSEKLFSDCLDEWLKSIQKTYKKNTLDSYESTVRNHLRTDFGAYRLKNLTTSILQTWLDEQKDSYSKSTVKTFYAVLKTFFRWALVTRKYVQENPMTNVSLPRYFTLPKKTHVFTPEEIEAIFDRFSPPHTFYMPLMLAYCCGMRLGECLALTWDNVDFDKQTINIFYNQYDKKNTPTKDTPKSLTSIRIVTFGQKLYLALKQKQLQQKKARFKAGSYYKDTGENLVCTDDIGQGLTANDLRYFGMWCKENFGSGSFHGLRHTHATMLIESGMDIDYVSKRLGHSSMYTTVNIYDNVTKKREERAVKLMDEIL